MQIRKVFPTILFRMTRFLMPMRRAPRAVCAGTLLWRAPRAVCVGTLLRRAPHAVCAVALLLAVFLCACGAQETPQGAAQTQDGTETAQTQGTAQDGAETEQTQGAAQDGAETEQTQASGVADVTDFPVSRTCEEEDLTDLLSAPDAARALAASRPSCVAVTVGENRGQGVIIAIDAREIVIATAAHVVAGYDPTSEDAAGYGFLCFFDEQPTPIAGVTLSRDAQLDLALVTADRTLLPPETVSALRAARPAPQEEILIGTPIFAVSTTAFPTRDARPEEVRAGSVLSRVATASHAGIVTLPEAYIESLDGVYTYCSCSVAQGMSGGGVFDFHGRLIGLVTGGTEENELAVLPVARIFSDFVVHFS